MHHDESCSHTSCGIGSGSQACGLLQQWICPNHQISSNLKPSGMKRDWLQSALLIELRWPFSNKSLLKERSWTHVRRFPFLPLGGPRGPVHTVSSGRRRRRDSRSIRTWKTRRIMSNQKNKFRRMLLRDERSHGLSFFPRLPPDVYTMSTDEDGAGFWVFLHCPSHPLF